MMVFSLFERDGCCDWSLLFVIAFVVVQTLFVCRSDRVACVEESVGVVVGVVAVELFNASDRVACVAESVGVVVGVVAAEWFNAWCCG